jgi:hypothetical protein
VPLFKRKPKVRMSEFCRNFYNQDILHAVIRDTDINAAWCNQVRKSVVEVDPAFASVDLGTLTSEWRVLRFEVFAAAWVHGIQDHKLGEPLILMQTLFTKQYLEVEGRLDIWEAMGPYNQWMGQVVAEYRADTPLARDYLIKLDTLRSRLTKWWSEQGYDEECIKRAVNRLYPEDMWTTFFAPWTLMLVLQDHLGCEVINEEAQNQLTYFIRGLYDGARDAIREVNIEP